MSAGFCGKRSNISDDSPSPPASKRIRCSSSSPDRTISPPGAPGPSSYSVSNSGLDHLGSLFPDIGKQFLEKALEESGGDLDSAIKRLNDIRLSAAPSASDIAQETATQSCAQVINNVGETAPKEPPLGNNVPANGAEWVDLLVREVLSASNVEDAKARLSRALEALEKSICANASAEATKSFQEENVMLRQQLEALLQGNTILKRAVYIQHERQKEFEEMSRELHQLKQQVSQYREQLRTLEVNNYALAMHLKQAQQNSSFPGHFNRDVF